MTDAIPPVSVHPDYYGLYVGPFRKKVLETDRNVSPVISAETREIDFDEIYLFLKNYIEREWAPQHSCSISFVKAESRIYSTLMDQNVKTHIDRADFLVVDISGDNRNALLELGYAEGKGKHYVIVGQKATDLQLPSDKSGRLLSVYDPRRLEDLAQHIGGQLDYLRGEIDRQKDADRFDIQCLSRRDVNMIDNEIQGSFHCIHILQTNLETINANHLAHIKSRMAQIPDLKLRILTLDPQSSYVNERAKQLGRTGDEIGVYRQGLVVSLEQAKLELKEYSRQAMIKVYDDFPTQMTYRFDDRLLVGVVSQITKSRENCSFLIDNIDRKGVGQSFLAHFRGIWNAHNTRKVFGEVVDDQLLEVH